VVFLSTAIDLGTKICATKPAVLLGVAWNCGFLSSVALGIAENSGRIRIIIKRAVALKIRLVKRSM
jgi:hypothetical protein